ncbi:MAG: hypothetical protein AMK71_11205, partial [Nitrospira bacterium SG8_35_4]
MISLMNFFFDKADKHNFRVVVFESAININERVLRNYIKKSIPVYFLEPFVSYHIRRGPFHGFSGSVPDYVGRLLQRKEIELLRATSIEGKNIYRQACDKAVDVIESVFPVYKGKYTELIELIAHTLKSPVAENAFKKKLCDDLADFYSVNILLHRIEKLFGSGPILFYPDTNIS